MVTVRTSRFSEVIIPMVSRMSLVLIMLNGTAPFC